MRTTPNGRFTPGLAIAEAVGRLGTVAGPVGTLACRVGIATGHVVVGDVIGHGSSLELQVVGETPNLAAGIVTMAEPGMVAICEATRHLTGELFDYKVLGPAKLKVSPTPVHAWAALSERQIDSRFEALRTGNLPLVDRTEELDLLLRRWDQAKAGEGRVVLSLESRESASHGWSSASSTGSSRRGIVRFVCSPHHQDSPLYPIVRQIERAAKFETRRSREL